MWQHEAFPSGRRIRVEESNMGITNIGRVSHNSQGLRCQVGKALPGIRQACQNIPSNSTIIFTKISLLRIVLVIQSIFAPVTLAESDHRQFFLHGITH